MKKGIVLFFVLVVTQSAFGQGYKTGLGIRATTKYTGLTLRTQINEKYALDANAMFSTGAFVASLFAERCKHYEQLTLHAGGGVHLGAVNNQGKGRVSSESYNGRGALYGIQLIGGFEWMFPSLNLALGADVIPVWEWNTSYLYVALGLTGRVSIDKPTQASPSNSDVKR